MVATCIDGRCGTEDVAADTILTAQVPGDCRVRQCDGAGSVIESNDDGDLPDDDNECTEDLCSAGLPVHPSVPPGTPLATQVTGDCREALCDGAGAVVFADRDGDVPNDHNECTNDLCAAGVASHTPVAAGEVCSLADGGYCDGGGLCVECLVDSDCPSGVCSGNACQVPACTDGVLNGDEVGIDCGGTFCGACAPAPVITSASLPIVALGGEVVLTGTGFSGVTTLRAGAATQPFVVDSDTQITVGPISNATQIGARNLSIGVPGALSASFSLTFIRLQINELDSDTPTTPINDANEFVEISTGVPNVSLSDYVLVLYNGSGDTSYLTIRLNATTDASGLLLVGNTAVTPAPALTFPNNTLQNGPDAVALYQALPAAFPNATPVTAARLIDTVVYGTNDGDDPGLLDTLLGAASPARHQADEGATAALSETQSIQRCSDGRRDGSRFLASTPTPGADNTVTCP